MTPRAVFRRCRDPFVSVGLALLLVGGTGVATAATGGTFLLGRTNYAGNPTTLANTGTGSALRLSTAQSTVPPLTVGTNRTRVPYLNGDLLDGLDSTQLQRRVSGSCLPGSAISALNASGGVSCATFPDTTQLQRRVSGSCLPGSAISAVDASGGVSCATFPAAPAKIAHHVTADAIGNLRVDALGAVGAGTLYAQCRMPGELALYFRGAEGTYQLSGVTSTNDGAPSTLTSGGLLADTVPVQVYAAEGSYARFAGTLMVETPAGLTQLDVHALVDWRDRNQVACTVLGTLV